MFSLYMPGVEPEAVINICFEENLRAVKVMMEIFQQITML